MGFEVKPPSSGLFKVNSRPPWRMGVVQKPYCILKKNIMKYPKIESFFQRYAIFLIVSPQGLMPFFRVPKRGTNEVHLGCSLGFIIIILWVYYATLAKVKDINHNSALLNPISQATQTSKKTCPAPPHTANVFQQKLDCINKSFSSWTASLQTGTKLYIRH